MSSESKVEAAKRSSAGLRGDIARTLATPAAEHFEGDDKTLLKFHGIYEQYDRDKKERIEERRHNFMVRVALPGGALTAQQYRALDDLAGRFGGDTLRLTTRQGVQFHGLLLGELKPALGEINRALLTTLAACGDVRRNVAACPAPVDDDAHRTVQAMARALAEALQPRTRAYHEIWLDGERLPAEPERDEPAAGGVEPFYRDTYLPRKFKIGVALDRDNCVDLFTQDAGLLAVSEVRDGLRQVVGYNLVAGGGLGITHGKSDTFARLASTIGYFPAPAAGDTSHGVAAIRAVGEIYRDHGNRSDRKRARLKYVVEEWGVERFRDEVARRLPFPLAPPRATGPVHQDDHLGRHAQGDGRSFLGVFVESGRVVDRGPLRLRSALRAIAERTGGTPCGFRVTAQQSLLITDLDDAALVEVEQLLGEHGVTVVPGAVRRGALACPALPTCSLALTEAERALPSVLGDLETEFARLGIDDREVTVRMTGCPNGCARPYNADIGLVGKRPGHYQIYVGGGTGGDRLVDLYAGDVALGDIVVALRPLLERYGAERREGESLGDAWQRWVRGEGREAPEAAPARHLLTGREDAWRRRAEAPSPFAAVPS
jgi:sulfite reductase (ferredoxin)